MTCHTLPTTSRWQQAARRSSWPHLRVRAECTIERERQVQQRDGRLSAHLQHGRQPAAAGQQAHMLPLGNVLQLHLGLQAGARVWLGRGGGAEQQDIRLARRSSRHSRPQAWTQLAGGRKVRWPYIQQLAAAGAGWHPGGARPPTRGPLKSSLSPTCTEQLQQSSCDIREQTGLHALVAPGSLPRTPQPAKCTACMQEAVQAGCGRCLGPLLGAPAMRAAGHTGHPLAWLLILCDAPAGIADPHFEVVQVLAHLAIRVSLQEAPCASMEEHDGRGGGVGLRGVGVSRPAGAGQLLGR